MADNVKIRTEDVAEILDGKILATSPHTQLAVLAGETYSSVLAKIAARSPTLDEKQALQNSEAPSALNEVVTVSALSTSLAERVPWKTIGPIGSGSDFEGATDAVFNTAFASLETWFYVREGTYTFASTVIVPSGVKLYGATSGTTTLTSASPTAPTLELLQGADLAYIGVSQTDATIGATAVLLSGDNVIIRYCLLQTAALTGFSLSGGVSSRQSLSVLETVFAVGGADFSVATALSDSRFISCVWLAPGAAAGLALSASDNVVVIASIFQGGQLSLTSCSNCRILGNHLNDGQANITPISSVLFRANTPASVNNESDDFTNLLQYIGSPSVLDNTPAYSSDFGGPAGENLTSRISSLDLLTQWQYEERNFQLLADEITTVEWAPSTGTLTTSGPLKIKSAHRQAYWLLPTIPGTVLADGVAIYYILDRTLSGSDISLTPNFAPIGSLPLNSSNRQLYVLAFRSGTSLWWRGGNGSRFPGTGNQTGTYFVDGTSQSLLTFLGATDYNDSDPNYSNNFAGVQGESLVTRAGKLDLLVKRLFEYSNEGIYVGLAGAAISVEPGPPGALTLTLLGTLYISLPHVAGRITLAAGSWDLQADQILYVEWNEGTLAGADQAVTGAFVVAQGALPLPDNYPAAARYKVLARRDLTTGNIYLWDNSELPSGGRWPIPRGRTVVRTAAPVTLADNVVWNGTDLLWENLAVAVSTGAPLTRNSLVNQLVASPGLTDLASNEGLLITHTWNPPGAASDVSITKVSLPLSTTPLRQNQFLWVQRLSGDIIFSDY